MQRRSDFMGRLRRRTLGGQEAIEAHALP